jgi:hypothetical protein
MSDYPQVAIINRCQRLKAELYSGVNAYSIQNDQRRFIDDEDLNRAFPGKLTETGVNNTLIKLMKNTTVIQYS